MIATATTLARLTDLPQSRNLITFRRRNDGIGHLNPPAYHYIYSSNTTAGVTISKKVKAYLPYPPARP